MLRLFRAGRSTLVDRGSAVLSCALVLVYLPGSPATLQKVFDGFLV